jgi:hypothetical protein
LCGACRYDWGSCEAPNKANIERFTSVLAKCIKKAVDAGKDIAVLAHLDLEKVSRERGCMLCGQNNWPHFTVMGSSHTHYSCTFCVVHCAVAIDAVVVCASKPQQLLSLGVWSLCKLTCQVCVQAGTC